MELIPAIDLLGGRVVRLSRGAYDAGHRVRRRPGAVARRWAEEGATRLHVVDLDGAREGRPLQADVVAAIVAAVGVPCQVAGGIRGAEERRRGARRRRRPRRPRQRPHRRPGLGPRLVDRHGPERIVAALDVRDGRALGDGWVAGARGADAMTLAGALASSRRAPLRGDRHRPRRWSGRSGPGPAGGGRAAVPGAAVIASGGVGSLADIAALAGRGFEAAILGRALYEGAFTLAEALAVAGDAPLERPG